MNCEAKVAEIKESFKDCESVFFAIGDKTRQAVITVLMETDCRGMRVGEIAKKTHLSRASAAHHLKILKDIEIVNFRKEGTMNYYFLEASSKLMRLKHLINVLEELITEQQNMQNLSEGGNEYI